ncbi:MAG: hypothetical protein JSW25_08100 [Thermoplasmata archaeon]|nr:MAG: hypothetical protein JSW25_08100 [Thermoplasmata archaeon]
MAERVPFYHASETVNEDLIVRRLDRHGSLVCWATEVPLEPVYLTTDRPKTYRGDVLALFEGPRGHALVGIEVKDWDARVSIPMARDYLEAYGKACQFFYLAANGFAEGLFSIKDLGLFHLDRREVVKAPGPLVPDPILWRSAADRLCELCEVDVDLPRDPGQSTLPRSE